MSKKKTFKDTLTYDECGNETHWWKYCLGFVAVLLTTVVTHKVLNHWEEKAKSVLAEKRELCMRIAKGFNLEYNIVKFNEEDSNCLLYGSTGETQITIGKNLTLSYMDLVELNFSSNRYKYNQGYNDCMKDYRPSKGTK